MFIVLRIWSTVGEILQCERESDNVKDRYAIHGTIYVGGHLPLVRFAISPNWQAKLQDLDDILQTYHSEIPYSLVRSSNSSRWNYGRQPTIRIRCTIKVSQGRHVNTVDFHEVTHARGGIAEHKFHASYYST